MAPRTIRAVVEIQVNGTYTEEALRMELVRLVIGKIVIPREAKRCWGKHWIKIKSYTKLLGAERRRRKARQAET